MPSLRQGYFLDRKISDTGWLRETVNCNFSLTELKSAKNGLAQRFSSRKFREVLIFWCLKRARWKKFPLFRIVPKWCVFQPDLVTVSQRKGPHFFFTNGVHYVIHPFSFISLGGQSPVLMSELNICGFLGPPVPENGPKWLQGHCDHVRLENTPRWHNHERRESFFTWPFWDIKISKPP